MDHTTGHCLGLGISNLLEPSLVYVLEDGPLSPPLAWRKATDKASFAPSIDTVKAVYKQPLGLP